MQLRFKASILFVILLMCYLKDQVTTSLELLRNAGIKIWMLTGDKLETAICIAKSSGLFSKSDNVHVFGQVQTRIEAHNELNALRRLVGWFEDSRVMCGDRTPGRSVAEITSLDVSVFIELH